jgi:hypothetical protein
MPINTAQIRSLLEPGLYKVDGRYDQLPKVFPKIFKTQQSKLDVDRMARMRLLGLPALKAEGGQTAFDNQAGHRYYYNARTQEIALAFAITRRSMEYNQYKDEFNQTVLNMPQVFIQYKETLCASIFNTGTVADNSIGGDGLALFHTAHTYDGGTWGNRPATDATLSETSLINAQTAIRTGFVDEAGLKAFFRSRKVLVHPNNEAVARRLLGAELRPGTMNNDPNVIGKMDGAGLSESNLIVWDFLTSSSAWFLLTNIEGFVLLEKVKFETSMWTDDSTGNLNVKGYEMYTPAFNDPRAAYGNFPS